MNKIIKIELLSDACIGGGSGLGSLIDIDVEHDSYGLPYIPSKRLYGLLKEASKEVLEDFKQTEYEDTFYEMFGKAGQVNSGSLKIRNAYVENYDAMKKELDLLNRTEINMNEGIHLLPEDVLNAYTNIRYNTSIDVETGVAKEHSLRSTRVVDKGTTFVASVDCGEHEDELKMLCKLVHHMGLRRTRGLGVVRMSVEDQVSEDIEHRNVSLEDDQYYEFKLIFKNNTDLMICEQKSSESLPYVKGSNIFGYLVGKYLKGKQLSTEEFYNEFLDPELKLHCSNAYVTSSDEETMMCSNALFKVKDESRYFNTANEQLPNDLQCSMFRNHFTTETFKSNEFEVNDVYMKLNAHHQRPQDRSYGHALEESKAHHQRSKDRSYGDAKDNVGAFYQYVAIGAGQKFVSTISGKGVVLKKLLQNLSKDQVLCVGKSSKNQYGELCLVNDPIKVEKEELTTNHFVMVVRGPAILVPKDFSYDNDNKRSSMVDVLIDEFKQQYGIDESIKVEKTYLQYQTCGGFNRTWMLPMEQKIALKPGSTIVCKCDKDITIDHRFYVGERTYGGCGEVIVMDYTDMDHEIIEQPIKNVQEEVKSVEIKEIMPLVRNKIVETFKMEIYAKAMDDAKKFSSENVYNSAKIGRINLIVSNCKSINDVQKQFNNTRVAENKENIEFHEQLNDLLRYVKNNEQCVNDKPLLKDEFEEFINDKMKYINKIPFKKKIRKDLEMFYLKSLLTIMKNQERTNKNAQGGSVDE